MASSLFRLRCLLFFSLCMIQQYRCQLVVKVKTKDGDVVSQTFHSDPVKNVVSVFFKLGEESVITVLLDFHKKRKIFQVIVLGEMDKAESSYEAMCFVTGLLEDEFISPDAMSKLRQKNPSTVRVPEDDVASESHFMDYVAAFDTSYITDQNINQLCKDAGRVLFKHSDLKLLLPENATRQDLGKLETVSEDLSGRMKLLKRCKDTPELSHECICKFEVCISWYPCQLKYCQGQDAEGQISEYRCGIRTCGKCHDFTFYVRERQHCFWDMDSS